jgi:hypothetical protein
MRTSWQKTHLHAPAARQGRWLWGEGYSHGPFDPVDARKRVDLWSQKARPRLILEQLRIADVAQQGVDKRVVPKSH